MTSHAAVVARGMWNLLCRWMQNYYEEYTLHLPTEGRHITADANCVALSMEKSQIAE